jgi:hypothetical protein
MIVQPRK